MNVTAISKYAKVSASKARDLTRSIQGLSIEEALKIVDFSSRKAARLIGKTIKSAIGNAENNAKLSVDTLVVKEAVVDSGPSQKRYWPRARGSASEIRRQTCHIKIVLTDGRDEAEKEVVE